MTAGSNTGAAQRRRETAMPSLASVALGAAAPSAGASRVLAWSGATGYFYIIPVDFIIIRLGGYASSSGPCRAQGAVASAGLAELDWGSRTPEAGERDH